MTKGWVCRNCGNQHEQTDDLKSLGGYMTDRGVCLTRCQACGSYVVAYRTGLHSGQFLKVIAKYKAWGRGLENGRA